MTFTAVSVSRRDHLTDYRHSWSWKWRIGVTSAEWRLRRHLHRCGSGQGARGSEVTQPDGSKTFAPGRALLDRPCFALIHALGLVRKLSPPVANLQVSSRTSPRTAKASEVRLWHTRSKKLSKLARSARSSADRPRPRSDCCPILPLHAYKRA